MGESFSGWRSLGVWVLKSSMVSHRVGEAREEPLGTEVVKFLRAMETRETSRQPKSQKDPS